MALELMKRGFIDTLVLYKGTQRDLDRGIDGSYQHAEGINKAFQKVQNEIFCVQDCDFFWVAKDFCKVASRVLAHPRMVAFGATHQVLCVKSRRYWLRLKLGNLVAALLGNPTRNTFESPAFFGAFCKTRVIRDNHLSFDFIGMDAWHKTGYDVAYQVNQYIERYHKRDYVMLKPQPIEEYRRGYMCAYLYRFQGVDFGMHLLSGSSTRDSFRSDELYQQTVAMRKRFMEDAISRAHVSKGVPGL
jgi:hypothetical protein